jgi:hypothetical protein
VEQSKEGATRTEYIERQTTEQQSRSAKCKEVRAEEAIYQVNHVSIKRAGDKNSTLPRHLREMNEEELAKL